MVRKEVREMSKFKDGREGKNHYTVQMREKDANLYMQHLLVGLADRKNKPGYVNFKENLLYILLSDSRNYSNIRFIHLPKKEP